MTENGGGRHGKGCGYRRPPADHRIKPGEVRNPYGRNGKPGPKKDFLDETIEITVDGKPVKVTRETAIDHGLFRSAIQGNVSAAKELGLRALRRARIAEQERATDSALTEDEQAALDDFAQRHAKELDARRVRPVTRSNLSPGAKK